MDRIEEIRGFTAVADARSFSRAARRLGISSAQISKLVARLEDRLGVRLLNRTTRDVSLTDSGSAYLARARDLLETFDQLESSVGGTGGPRGLMRVSLPVSFGAVEIGPALLDFAAAYGQVGLEVSFSDRAVNLVEEGFDAAVRIGNLSDSSLVARRLAATRVVTCASPAYLVRHGTPAAPDDLSGREIIIDLNLRDPFVFEFGRGVDHQTGCDSRAPRPASRRRVPASASRVLPPSPRWTICVRGACNRCCARTSPNRCRSTSSTRRRATSPPRCAPSSISWCNASPANPNGTKDGNDRCHSGAGSSPSP
jgi:DNA-binding transcriptional LysR family regulator